MSNDTNNANNTNTLSNKPIITIPLEEYVGCLVGNRQYGVISLSQATAIMMVEGYQRICMIENEDMVYTDMTNQLLPKLANNNHRIWLRSTFEIFENAKRKRAQQRQLDEAYDMAVRTQAAETMARNSGGLFTLDMVIPLLKNASRKQLEEMLMAAGVELPKKENA